MEPHVLRDGDLEVEVQREVTATGPRLRLKLASGATVSLDPLELEGLTRLPFTAFPALDGARMSEGSPPASDREVEVLRNEFAMVQVALASDADGDRLVVRNMASMAEVGLGPRQLERLVGLRHRDLAPLVDPSGLAAEEEPDPDQV